MNTAWEKLVVSHWPYVAGITAIWWIARWILQHSSKIPTLGDSKDSNFITAIEQGCKKYPESCFQIPTPDFPTVVVPLKCLQAIAYSPENKLSLGREVYQRLMGRYTKMVKSDHLADFVRVGLTKSAMKNISVLQEEAEWAVSSEIGKVLEWKSTTLFQTMITLVSLHISRSFIGPPLCHDQAWINLTLDYAISTVTVAGKMGNTHWALRPVKALFLPEIREMSKQFQKAADLLRPILEARLRDDKDKKRPCDLMQWIIDTYPNNKDDLILHTRLQLEAVQAATFNLAFQLVHFFYDLLAHPEYIEPLRREAQETFDACGGRWNQAALSSMRKCDSFLKESQRLNPIAVVTVSRFVLSPMQLPDNTKVPAGISVSAPTMTINTDPSLWTNPKVFDGYRFEKLRNLDGSDRKFQFSSISASELNWGYGVHACPGRHFASNQIKILITQLLLHYELRFESDDESPTRPPNTVQGVRIIPNAQAKVLIRSRQSAL